MMPFVLMLSFMLSLGACGKPRIRVANDSDTAMADVVVRFPSQSERYGTIPAHGTTEYREVERAYSYAYIEATVNGERAVLQPIDFVGEKLLDGGKYTYGLDVNEKAASRHELLRFRFVSE